MLGGPRLKVKLTDKNLNIDGVGRLIWKKSMVEVGGWWIKDFFEKILRKFKFM